MSNAKLPVPEVKFTHTDFYEEIDMDAALRDVRERQESSIRVMNNLDVELAQVREFIEMIKFDEAMEA